MCTYKCTVCTSLFWLRAICCSYLAFLVVFYSLCFTRSVGDNYVDVVNPSCYVYLPVLWFLVLHCNVRRSLFVISGSGM